MSSKQCVVGIGEILMDVFENGEATLGGAPFNVAFHVHQLLNALSLGEAVVLSAVDCRRSSMSQQLPDTTVPMVRFIGG
jgi:hypothetical protein